MMAANSTSEPKIKKEATADIKPKKHVKIKEEPIRLSNSPSISDKAQRRPIIPITPNEKILKHPPNLKSIDNLNINRFIIPTKEDQNEDVTPTKSTGSKRHGGEQLVKSKELQNREGAQHGNVHKRLKQQSSHSQSTISPTSSSATFDNSSKNQVLPEIIEKTKKAVVKPPKFQPFEESIISNDQKDEIDLVTVFQNIDDEVNKGKYIDIGSKSFDDWCDTGIKLTNIQYGIVKKVINSRNKLNLKFGMILKLINQNGESLENEDMVLKEKMKRLQNLGEEIRNFIK